MFCEDVWELFENYDDFNAVWKLGDALQVKCASFWKEKDNDGPFSVKNYKGQPKVLEAHVKAAFEVWEKAVTSRGASKVSPSKLTEEVDVM